MTISHKILATTALCLAAVGLGSCISATHRVVKTWGQSADAVYWARSRGLLSTMRIPTVLPSEEATKTRTA